MLLICYKIYNLRLFWERVGWREGGQGHMKLTNLFILLFVLKNNFQILFFFQRNICTLKKMSRYLIDLSLVFILTIFLKKEIILIRIHSSYIQLLCMQLKTENILSVYCWKYKVFFFFFIFTEWFDKLFCVLQ